MNWTAQDPRIERLEEWNKSRTMDEDHPDLRCQASSVYPGESAPLSLSDLRSVERRCRRWMTIAEESSRVDLSCSGTADKLPLYQPRLASCNEPGVGESRSPRPLETRAQ